MNPEARIELGKIASAHGLGGELNYVPFNQSSELPFEGMPVTLVMPGGRESRVTVESIRDKGKILIIGISGCEDRTAAEKLQGALVVCSRSDLPELKADEFYYRDALGLEVRYPDGTVIGRCSQVLSLATDVIEITSESGDEWMVPVVEGFVREIGPGGIVIEFGALEME